jgi:hypothetical protein
VGNPYYPQGAPGPYGPPPQQPYGPPPYGPPPRRSLDLSKVSLAKVASVVVMIAGVVVLFCSLLSLYTVTVTPSAIDVPDNDAPSGDISVGIGFYDVVPFLPPPVVAQAIPLLMVLAALSTGPVLFSSERKTAPLAAVFSGAAALLAFVLTISNPLPSVELSGELASQLEDELGGQSLGELVDSVASVGPGAGLIVALIFGIIGWVAAVLMSFERKPVPVPPPPSAPPMYPPHQPGW